ncbi:MAG: hypothetical protein JST46_04360 [Bacteroidetes bacterium]|nr:hypothetical protein [Bacteroidota bacterium]
MLRKLTYHSYTIVKVGSASILLVIVLAYYLFKVEISLPIVAIFFFVSGIFVGYVIAYYSIKYLRDEGIKKRFPLN